MWMYLSSTVVLLGFIRPWLSFFLERWRWQRVWYICGAVKVAVGTNSQSWFWMIGEFQSLPCVLDGSCWSTVWWLKVDLWFWWWNHGDLLFLDHACCAPGFFGLVWALFHGCLWSRNELRETSGYTCYSCTCVEEVGVARGSSFPAAHVVVNLTFWKYWWWFLISVGWYVLL